MANKRINDLPSETDPASTDVLAVDGATTRKATRADILGDNLEAVRGLTSAADKVPYFTGAGTADVADLTTYGRSIVAVANEAALKALVNLEIGTDVQAYDSDLAALAANSTNGLWARTGAGTGAARTLTAPAAGVTVSNGDGVSGNPTLALANDLAALEGLSGTGIARRTGADAWSTGDAVANSELAAMNAYTFKMNATGSSAVPTDVDIGTLTTKASPDSGDYVLISDQAAGGAVKKATVASMASAGSVASIDGQTGAFTTDDSLSSASNVLRAQFKGHINGLTLSNNATDATNDIDIAAGEAADTDGILMVLSSALTKRLDAAWAVGTGNGGLDTGSIADTTYHVFLIQRSDTGVVDALFSTSPSSPTMPTNYDRKRRIGAILRESAAIVAFRQNGDVFKRNTQVVVRNSTSVVTDTLLDMKVPTGVKVAPLLIADCQLSTAGQLIQLLSDGDLSAANESCNRVAGTEYSVNVITGHWITNTSGQLRFSLVNGSGTPSSARIQTQGWIDGRDQ